MTVLLQARLDLVCGKPSLFLSGFHSLVHLAHELEGGLGPHIVLLIRDIYQGVSAVAVAGEIDRLSGADGFQQADYEQLVKELFSGERTVSADTEKIPAVSNIKVDDQGAIKG